MYSIKYNGVYHWTMARTSLAISKIYSQDIQVTIRFSDRPRQFRLIGYQLDESHTTVDELRRISRFSREYDSPIRSAFSLAICFGPRQEAVSFEDWISIRRIRMTVTGLLRVSIRFIVFVVSWVGRRTDGLPISTIAYLQWITMRSISIVDCLSQKIMNSILEIN